MSIENLFSGLGRIGKDLVVRFTAQGTAVTTMSVALNRKFKDREGQLREETTWMGVQLWGQAAENAGKFLHKGSLVAFQGPMIQRSWEDQNGVKRWTMECRANLVKYLDPAPDRPPVPPVPEDEFPNPPDVSASGNGGGEAEEPVTIPDDDIPF